MLIFPNKNQVYNSNLIKSCVYNFRENRHTYHKWEGACQALFILMFQITHIAFKSMCFSYMTFLFLPFFFSTCHKFHFTNFIKIRSKSSFLQNMNFSFHFNNFLFTNVYVSPKVNLYLYKAAYSDMFEYILLKERLF